MNTEDLKSEFILHPQLKNDTFFIGSLPLCDLRLMNDSRYPWLILIPRVPEVTDMTDLSAEERAKLTEEINYAAAILKAYYDPDRLNIAMLGNVVPQLHCHLVARFETDFAWPKPVWGPGEAVPYTKEEREKVIALLHKLLLI
jgi:diadenosine tetraphosphate (Ap4A) HIT family hydrolase